MKKYLTANNGMILATVILIGFFYYRFNGFQATLCSVFLAAIVFGIISYREDTEYAKKSFENPYWLSPNDAGTIFAVEDIRGGKIGLTQYYLDGGILLKDGRISYYWIQDFPEEVRNVGSVIDVRNDRQGLTVTKRAGQMAGPVLHPEES